MIEGAPTALVLKGPSSNSSGWLPIPRYHLVRFEEQSIFTLITDQRDSFLAVYYY